VKFTVLTIIVLTCVSETPCRADPTYILKSDVVVEADKVREVLSQDGFKEGTECETTDIYLLPPHEVGAVQVVSSSPCIQLTHSLKPFYLSSETVLPIK
jgi:hypothetical protein